MSTPIIFSVEVPANKSHGMDFESYFGAFSANVVSEGQDCAMEGERRPAAERAGKGVKLRSALALTIAMVCLAAGVSLDSKSSTHDRRPRIW